jgi:nucleoside-diphosphate-sugar epimerase
MRVLLTGAAGFLGSQIARLLVGEDREVFALLRPQGDPWRIRDLLPSLQVVECDFLGSTEDLNEQVARIRPDLCLHFAWYTDPSTFLHSPLNLRYLPASLALAAALAEAGCKRLVVAGTFSEYNQRLGYLSEDSPTLPCNLYAASKLALYLSLSHWAPAAGVELLWPRIFSVYGPGEHEKRFVPAVMLAALRGEPTRLTPGEQIRDYLHVADAASAVWVLAQGSLTGPVNVASGQPVAISELALHIGELIGRPDLIRLGDLPYRQGDPMFVCANVQLLKSNTGWVPRFDLKSGLHDTLNWWQTRVGTSSTGKDIASS